MIHLSNLIKTNLLNFVQREIVFLNHPEYLIRWLDQRHAVTNVRSLLRLADLEVEVDEQALRKFLDRSVEVEVVDGVPQEEVKKIWKETKEDSVYLGTTKQIRARRAIRAVRANIDQHAASETHETHPCSFDSCASTFTCKPDRLRHEMLHTNDELPKYPCTHCRRHRGVNGFKRKDHLTQHLRNYHHIQPESSQGWRLVYACSHDDCRDYRPESPKEESLREDFGYPFKTLAARTKHLKEVHNESKFPCPVPLCEKVGGQGYERKSDLVKHINAKHPKAPSSP